MRQDLYLPLNPRSYFDSSVKQEKEKLTMIHVAFFINVKTIICVSLFIAFSAMYKLWK